MTAKYYLILIAFIIAQWSTLSSHTILCGRSCPFTDDETTYAIKYDNYWGLSITTKQGENIYTYFQKKYGSCLCSNVIIRGTTLYIYGFDEHKLGSKRFNEIEKDEHFLQSLSFSAISMLGLW